MDGSQLSPTGRPDSSTVDRQTAVANYLRQCRARVSELWTRQIMEYGLLGQLKISEVSAATARALDAYVEALGSGSTGALQACAASLYRRLRSLGADPHHVAVLVLLLGDLLLDASSDAEHALS